MRAFIEELKAAVTGLGRSPGFTALSAGVLGLGLGAVIFMYGVADTLMMKPPPYPNADRIYTIVTHDGQIAGRLRQLAAAARLAEGARSRGRPLRGARRHLHRHDLPDRRRPGRALRRRLRRRAHFRRDRRRARARAHHPPARHDRGRDAGRRPVPRAVERALRFGPGRHRPHGARERQVLRSHRRDAGGLHLPVRGRALGREPAGPAARRRATRASTCRSSAASRPGRRRRRGAAGARAGRSRDQGGSRAAGLQRPLRAASGRGGIHRRRASRSS